MLLRVRSPDGMKRISLEASDTIINLLQLVEAECSVEAGMYSLYAEIAKKQTDITDLEATVRVAEYLKHGDMLTLKVLDTQSDMVIDEPFGRSSATDNNDSNTNGSAVPTQGAKVERAAVIEDKVDQIIRKQNGLITRKRDKTMCSHGPRGMCDHCRALDAWDENYLKENNIKHMSFHAFLRKQSGGMKKDKHVSLSDTSLRIKTGCTTHPPWPEGICSKCQPSAVTLKRQTYRHTDHVEFESSTVVNEFVNFWRQSGGAQRMGYLYGRYEPYDAVPLGIKAVVMALYEPPQTNEKASLRVDPEAAAYTMAIVDRVAGYLGLQRVGWIFTDLEDDSTNQGTVLYKRHADTFFLSSLEAMTAADYQTSYPNACKDAENGYFGSKFVTVCVSGGDTNHVGLEAYQVSDQAMALYRDECLRPSRKMGRGRIVESTSEQYVPDVFYSHKNEYGVEETVAAKPSLPLDYLLVNVSVGSPQVPTPMFTAAEGNSFMREHREAVGDSQTLKALSAHLRNAPSFLTAVSDFHLLCYLATSPVFGIGDKIKELCEAVKDKNVALTNEWRSLNEWKTVEMMMDEPEFDSVGGSASASAGGATASDAEWTCAHCTFINHGRTDCEMCGLPQT